MSRLERIALISIIVIVITQAVFPPLIVLAALCVFLYLAAKVFGVRRAH